MNYFEFRDKRPALDVVEWPGIEVTEQELTPEELEQWTRIQNDSSKPSLLPPAFSPSRS